MNHRTVGRLSLGALVLLIVSAPGLAQRTLRVPAQFPTIQAAINVAVRNDTVLVSPGRYVENVRFLVTQSTSR